jgi:hypothetical protein
MDAFVESAPGPAFTDRPPCQPHIQPFIPVKVGDLSLPGKVRVSGTGSFGPAGHAGDVR